MARFDIEFPDEFLSSLLNTSPDDICQEALKETAPILEQAMKKEVSSVIKDVSTGEAVKSIKASKPQKSKNGAWIANVHPTGYSQHTFTRGKVKGRKYKVSNALKLIWLEYGNAHQPARPFMTRTTNIAKEAVMKKLQEVFNRKIGAK